MVPLSTLHAASAAIRLGRISPIDLLNACLERIDRYEPRVHAWIFVDRESARADAERADAEVRRGQWRGPLHGIPLGIKDIFDVFDWPTAAGSRLWRQSGAPPHATGGRPAPATMPRWCAGCERPGRSWWGRR